jgi:hypothetical protein
VARDVFPVSVAPDEIELPPGPGERRSYDLELETTDADVFDLTVAVVTLTGGDYDAEIVGVRPDPEALVTSGGVEVIPVSTIVMHPIDGETAYLFYLRHLRPRSHTTLSIAITTNRPGTGNQASVRRVGFSSEPAELGIRPSEADPGGVEVLVPVEAFGRTQLVELRTRKR